MPAPPITRILVAGAGTMGSQIAMVCALAGYRATAYDIDADALDRARTQLSQRMSRTVAKGQIPQAGVDAAFAQLAFTTDLPTAAAAADFVIEAAVERLDVKRDLFSAISQAAPPHVILTTNSSTVVSSKLADATELHKEIPGFIANRILGGDVRVGQSVAEQPGYLRLPGGDTPAGQLLRDGRRPAAAGHGAAGVTEQPSYLVGARGCPGSLVDAGGLAEPGKTILSARLARTAGENGPLALPYPWRGW